MVKTGGFFCKNRRVDGLSFLHSWLAGVCKSQVQQNLLRELVASSPATFFFLLIKGMLGTPTAGWVSERPNMISCVNPEMFTTSTVFLTTVIQFVDIFLPFPGAVDMDPQAKKPSGQSLKGKTMQRVPRDRVGKNLLTNNHQYIIYLDIHEHDLTRLRRWRFECQIKYSGPPCTAGKVRKIFDLL